MSKKNDDFFKEKKTWSVVKDELLRCYLTPYLQKILKTGKPVVYVDCFAGKGVFDDGKPGSPVIALDVIKDCLMRTQVSKWQIRPYFIELNHVSDLSVNLSEYKLASESVICGKYEDEINNILSKNEGGNVFLYIDPYGIKTLNCKLFGDISASGKYYSVELLINSNFAHRF